MNKHLQTLSSHIKKGDITGEFLFKRCNFTLKIGNKDVTLSGKEFSHRLIIDNSYNIWENGKLIVEKNNKGKFTEKEIVELFFVLCYEFFNSIIEVSILSSSKLKFYHFGDIYTLPNVIKAMNMLEKVEIDIDGAEEALDALRIDISKRNLEEALKKGIGNGFK